ncbi:T9SS type A sorting domain-containing protein [candidate division KSB1 bacterium]|nr:T9SS type A sorting domain-containing protein [candidate division KSB1 bacterium]
MKKLRYLCTLVMTILGMCLFTAEGLALSSQSLAKSIKVALIQAEKNHIVLPARLKRHYAILTMQDSGKNRQVYKTIANAADSVTTETIFQTWGSSGWINDYKEITTYRDAGQTDIERVNGYIWMNEAWQNESLMTFTYENNFPTKIESSLWLDGMWVVFLEMTNVHANGLLLLTTLKMDMLGIGELDYVSRNDMSYDGNNYLTRMNTYLWDGSAWMQDTQITFTNNAQGLPLEELIETTVDGMTFPLQKIATHYTMSGLPETVTTQEYEDAITGWVNSLQESTIYNDYDMPTELLFVEWDGSGWTNVRVVRTNYNESNATETLSQYWSESTWKNESRDTYTWNAGVLIEALTEVWLGSAWLNEEKVLFIQPETDPTAVADESLLPGEFALGNYPNPFNPSTTIFYNAPQDMVVSLRIIDAQGRTVASLLTNENVDAGNHQIQWHGQNSNGTPVASGIYFYSLTSELYAKTGRCLLLK